MGNHHVPIPSQVTRCHTGAWLRWLVLMAPLGLLIYGYSARAQDQGALPDVLIQAEEKRPLARNKPDLLLTVKEETPLESILKTEQELKTKLPSEIAQATRFVSEISNSPYIAAPTSHWIILAWKGESARILYPLKMLTEVYKEQESSQAKAQWQLAIVDAVGGVSRKFAGSGLPPMRLEFDGRNEEGQWLKAGQVYTGVLTYQSPSGRSYTAIGKPFALEGLSLQKANGFLISLAHRSLFENKEHGQLSEHGKKLLDEAAQLIQRHHPGLSLEVTYFSSLNLSLAQDSAEICAKELAKRLKLAALAAKAQVGVADLEQRLDIHILNR